MRTKDRKSRNRAISTCALENSNSTSIVEVVKGRATKAQHVVVGVCVGTRAPLVEGVVRWAGKRDGIILRKATPSRRRLLWEGMKEKCVISSGLGTEGFRNITTLKYRCNLTVLQGRNLSVGWSLGFYWAALRATGASLGLWPDECDEGMKASGWSVVGKIKTSQRRNRGKR